jgi:hypothetical protein
VNADFEIESPSGSVALLDASPSLSPAFNRDAATVAELKEQARIGNLFLIEHEDSARYRIRVLVEEEPPEELEKRFERVGGSFRLEAPSGTLAFWGGKASKNGPGPFEVPPGTYLLQPMMHRPFDSKEYRASREKLLGASDARYARIVDRIAMGGCLMTLFAAVLMMIAFWRRHKWTIIAVAVLPWLVHFLLRSLPRYRRIEKICQAHDKQWPHFVFLLKRTEAARELPGGWIRGPE